MTLVSLKRNYIKHIRGQLFKMIARMFETIAILLLHLSNIPVFVNIINGKHNVDYPPFDVVLFVWVALLSLFIKSMMVKNTLNIIAIMFGFFVQSLMMGYILLRG